MSHDRSSFAAVVGMGLLAAFAGCGARTALGVGHDLDADAGTVSDAAATPDASPVQQFVLSAKPTTLTVTQRKPPVSLAVHVQRLNGFMGTIEVTFAGLTPGLTGTKADLPAGVDDGIVQLSAADTSDQGPLTGVYLSGTSSGATEQKLPLDVFVRGCPGCIDKTFATKGRATPLALESITSISVDPSDRIAFTGYIRSPLTCLVGRLTKEGELDPTFGNGGLVVVSTAPKCYVTAVHADASHLIVVAGIEADAATESKILRLFADGSIDTSFGSGGTVSEPTPNGGLYSVLVDAQGVVTIGGNSDFPTESAIHILRLRPDGALDTTFGTGGRIRSPWKGQGDVGQLVFGPGGRILAIGDSVPPPNGPSVITLAGYLPSGAPDTAFGTQGITVSGFPSSILGTSGRGMVVAKDGRLWGIVNAYAPAGKARAALARFHSDGTIDESLDPKRLLVLEDLGLALTYAAGILEEATGDVLAVGGGFKTMKQEDPWPALLWRLHPDGTYDPEFGNGGTATFQLATHTDLEWSGLQSDGRIVIAGSTYEPLAPASLPAIVRVWN